MTPPSGPRPDPAHPAGDANPLSSLADRLDAAEREYQNDLQSDLSWDHMASVSRRWAEHKALPLLREAATSLRAKDEPCTRFHGTDILDALRDLEADRNEWRVYAEQNARECTRFISELANLRSQLAAKDEEIARLTDSLEGLGYPENTFVEQYDRLIDINRALRSRISAYERLLRDFAPIVRAAQDVVGAWRIGNVHEDNWLRRLDNAFRAVPDGRRPAFHAALDSLKPASSEPLCATCGKPESVGFQDHPFRPASSEPR